VALALAAGALGGCRRSVPALAVARVSSAQGDVTRERQAVRSAADVGAQLVEGDVVATGERSSAAVTFDESGTVISLDSSTALVIRRASPTATRLGAVLLKGSVRAAGKPGGVRFSIGTPYGLAELGGEPTESAVSVSAQEGLRVLLGTIELVAADGKRTRVEAGGGVSPTGVVVPLPSRPVITLAPFAIMVAADPRQVQIRPAGAADWKPASRAQPMASGDAVRTRRAAGTRVQVGPRAAVSLQADSELALRGSETVGGSLRARWALGAGLATFEVERGEGPSPVHEVQVGSETVVVEPGPSGARVEVRSSGAGQGRVTVRQGHALLASGLRVEAGDVVDVGPAGSSAPRPLAATQVELHAGHNAAVYYAGDLPAVRLSWAGLADGPYDVELAADRGFTAPSWHERLTSDGVVLDRMRPGRWFWRVRTGAGTSAQSFTLEPDRDVGCKTCKHANVIDENGENTVVYFQKVLPAITLRWPPVSGAARYRPRVFADGAFDEPLLEGSVSETSWTLPVGKLGAGRYFWLVQAVAVDGHEVAPGRINGLAISHDNAALDLEVSSPEPEATTDEATTTTTGEVRPGTRVWVNGLPAAVDRGGRFEVVLRLAAGDNTVVYRTLGQDGTERYYLRRVRRR
jgi:hypothetical protein